MLGRVLVPIAACCIAGVATAQVILDRPSIKGVSKVALEVSTFGGPDTGFVEAIATKELQASGIDILKSSTSDGACKNFCVKSHTLPERARKRYGQERYKGIFCGAAGSTAGRS
jgi:hypothetical protein